MIIVEWTSGPTTQSLIFQIERFTTSSQRERPKRDFFLFYFQYSIKELYNHIGILKQQLRFMSKRLPYLNYHRKLIACLEHAILIGSCLEIGKLSSKTTGTFVLSVVITYFYISYLQLIFKKKIQGIYISQSLYGEAD